VHVHVYVHDLGPVHVHVFDPVPVSVCVRAHVPVLFCVPVRFCVRVFAVNEYNSRNCLKAARGLPGLLWQNIIIFLSIPLKPFLIITFLAGWISKRKHGSSPY
jgi:hypothetical protein